MKDNILEKDIEPLCPICNVGMKEFVTMHRCRNLRCRSVIKKKFQIISDEQKRKGVNEECPNGGTHKWRIDGLHSNEFCGKCFVSKK